MDVRMEYTEPEMSLQRSASPVDFRQVESGAEPMWNISGENGESVGGQGNAQHAEAALQAGSPAFLGTFRQTSSSESSRHGIGMPSPYGAALETSFDFTSPPRVTYSDRFIPSRIASSLVNYSLIETSPASGSPQSSESREDGGAVYSSLLRTELFGSDASLAAPKTPEKTSGAPVRDSSPSPTSPVRNLFRFKSDNRNSSSSSVGASSPYSLSPVGDEDLAGAPVTSRRLPRRIARSPFKVLDAPALADDFYLNLVDWSEHNVLAVGLGTCIYLWSACTSKVTKLCDLGPDDTVCAVGWTQRGTYLAVGTNKGEVQIWDTVRCKKLRSLGGHRTRVGSLAWNSHILSSGGRDRIILHHDVRVEQEFVTRLTGHKSEVCGLKWSPDERELASGGNDNQLLVWNNFSTQPVLTFQAHQAAVKAIAWSPHQHGLLASGGGTADRCIRFWNTATGASLSCVDTGSQVCNLAWSKNVNEVVSTHGYSQNQIIIWRYPTMSKLATLTGHSMRVLFLSISPDGQTIVTGAGDETLRFWNAFPPAKRPASVRESGIWALGRTQIR